MKILYVGLGLFDAGGGAEGAIKELALALKEVSGDEIHFLTYGFSTKFSPRFKGSKLFTLGKKPTKFGWNFYKVSKRLEMAIYFLNNRYKYDLIFINTYAGYIPYVLSRKLKGCSVIIYNFNDQPSFTFFDKDNLPFSIIPSFWFLKAYFLKRRVITSHKKNRVFFLATSTFIKNDLINLGIPSQRIFVQPNGFPTKLRPKNRRISKKDVIFYSYGFNYKKGTDKLLQAFNMVSNNNWKLIIIGHLPSIQNSFIHKTLSKLKSKTQKNIFLTGRISDEEVGYVRYISDCYVSMSLSEACQLSVIEALETGISVCTSNVGIVPDLIEKEVNNLILLNLMDLKETASIINSFIEKMTKNPNFISTNSKNMTQLFFSWNIVAKRVLKLFYKLKSSDDSLYSQMG